MRREMCLQGTRCLTSIQRKTLSRPLLLPRIKGDQEERRKKRKRLLKNRDLRKHQSEIQEAQIEKWLQSTGRFPKKRWKIEQKRTLKAWFERLDKDGSGEIDVDELADPLMSTGLAKTMSEVNSLVRQVDDDRSSGIDFHEFLSVMKKEHKLNGSRAQHSKKLSAWKDIFEQKKFAGLGAKKERFKRVQNPIAELTRRQRSENMELKSVLSRERRKLLLDATMMQAERRERAHEQISRWRSEMKSMGGASKFRKLQDISILTQRLETDRVEKESFVDAMNGMLEKIQEDPKDHFVHGRNRTIVTPAHKALMKKRNVSMLSRDKEKRLVGSARKALVYPRTRNPSLPSILGISQKRVDYSSVRLTNIRNVDYI